MSKLEQNEIIINKSEFLKAVAKIVGKNSEEYTRIDTELGNKRVLARYDERLISKKELNDRENKEYERGFINGLARAFQHDDSPEHSREVATKTLEAEAKIGNHALSEAITALQAKFIEEVGIDLEQHELEAKLKGAASLATIIILPKKHEESIYNQIFSMLKDMTVFSPADIYNTIKDAYGSEFSKVHENQLTMTMEEFNKVLMMVPQIASPDLEIVLERQEGLTIEYHGKSKVELK